MCEEGGTGPLCAVCADNFFEVMGTCYQCPGSSNATTGLAVMGLAICTLVALLVVHWCLKYVSILLATAPCSPPPPLTLC